MTPTPNPRRVCRCGRELPATVSGDEKLRRVARLHRGEAMNITIERLLEMESSLTGLRPPEGEPAPRKPLAIEMQAMIRELVTARHAAREKRVCPTVLDGWICTLRAGHEGDHENVHGVKWTVCGAKQPERRAAQAQPEPRAAHAAADANLHALLARRVAEAEARGREAGLREARQRACDIGCVDPRIFGEFDEMLERAASGSAGAGGRRAAPCP